jgi:hypothetical protein
MIPQYLSLFPLVTEFPELRAVLDLNQNGSHNITSDFGKLLGRHSMLLYLERKTSMKKPTMDKAE